MNRSIRNRILNSLVLIVGMTAIAFAGGGTEMALVATGTITAFFVLFIFFVVFVLNGNIDALVRFFRALYDYIIPASEEEAPDLGHDFDGIRELDNRIPPWFNYLFAVTVLFAVIYALDYHVLGTSPLPTEEYNQEVAAADLMRRLRIASEGEIDEATLAVLTDGASLKAGAERYEKYCVSCHGAKGEGLVGPNLTDAYWVHGGSVKDVYATIKNGVPAKGMISWKLVFTPKEMQQVSSYILGMQGTNPPGGKKPEGELYVAPKQTASEKAGTGASI